jgi:hypothetical protein
MAVAGKASGCPGKMKAFQDDGRHVRLSGFAFESV